MAMRKLSARLLFVVFLAGGVQAWTQATTGSISGHVADPAGKVVQGAQVAVHDVDTGIETTAATDQSGEFDLTALPPGHYTIAVEAPGFDTSTVPAFDLNIDQKARFDISMKVGVVTSSVEVSGSAPILQTQGGETGQVIDGRELTDLPAGGP